MVLTGDLVELGRLSEDPEIPLNMVKVWNLFESYYPDGNFKDLFAQANQEKVKVLQQDTSIGMNMTCHKMLEKSSFLVGKKKKSDPKSSKSKASSSKSGQEKQVQITDMLPKKKKAQPTVSSGAKDQSETSEWSESEASSDPDENMDEKLKNFIQAGFFA